MKFSSIDCKLELSVEQQFQIELMEKSIKTMSHEQTKSLLIEASKLLMAKDNVIQSLMQNRIEL